MLTRIPYKDEKQAEPEDVKPAKDGESSEIKTSEEKTAASSSSAKPKRKAEPTSERLANVSRVTPAQLPYISFPPDARWTPVRPVVTSTSGPSPSAGSSPDTKATPSIGAGGGILLVRDGEPDKEAEFLELEVMKVLDTAGAAVPGAIPAQGADAVPSDLLTSEIAPMPAPFEYPDFE